MSIFKKNFILFFAIIAILISFGSGLYFGRLGNSANAPIEGVLNQDLGKPVGVDFSLFWDAWRKLQEKYVDKGAIDPQEMVYGAIAGMVKSLKDPYTVFFNPDENRRFVQDVQGTFEGIGAEIGKKDGQLLIIAPLEGTPAQKAGLKPGDQIIKINGDSAADLTVEEAINSIRGKKDTEVTLSIFRNEFEDGAKDFVITRAVIDVPSLKWELKNSNIAYIRIYQFSEKLAPEFKQAAAEILKSPAQKIILDLRGNPGGYLEVSQYIAGWFLKKGQVVVIEDFGERTERKKYESAGPSQFLDYPIIVLVNQGSASASEILAGALRDNRSIKLVGEKTFGKGSVQELTELKSESSLKVTIAKWLTPKGISIADHGLEPDIKVEFTKEDFAAERDPQLEKAVDIIGEIR